MSAADSARTSRRWGRSLRLRTRLALVATLFISIFVLSYSLLLLLEVPERADAETAGTMPWVLGLLPGHADPTAGTDAERIARLAALVRGLERIRHVRVALVLPDGALVASTPTVARTVPSGLSSRLSRPREPQRKAVMDGGRVLAYFEVTPAVNDELVELWEDFQRSMTLFVGLSAAAVALIVGFTFRLLAPLDRIGLALRELAAGRRGARLPASFGSAEMDRIAGSFNRMADALAQADAERQALLRKLVEADEHTRRSVAHDLHDDLSPYLVALQPLVRTLQLQCGRRADLADLAPLVDTVVSHQSHVLGRLKAILSGLHPPELATWGLRGSIEQMLALPRANAAGEALSVRFEPGGDWVGFGPTLDVSIFRLMQECLSNAQRHSNARSVDVRFCVPDRDGVLRIEVVNEADGPAGSGGVAGLGLLGMRDRCVALGGRFESGRVDGGRWRTRIEVPLEAG